MNNREKAIEKYYELFNDEDKVRAFDQIAEQYYFADFGTMQKSEYELLLFSLYFKQAIQHAGENVFDYSDYSMSKLLGISQSRISSLKEKVQLRTHTDLIDWKESFRKLCEHARYEEKRIRIYIPERYVYLEIKNAIECSGAMLKLS